jgi:hypothetical protein
MKHPGIVFLFLFIAFSASAQAPGYLGKRFFLKANISGSMALAGPTASNQGAEHYGAKGGGFGINWLPAMEVGYAISRRNALTINTGYFVTGMKMLALTPSLSNPNSYDARNDEHELFYQLKGFETGLGLQTFNPIKGAIAPMGIFTRISLNAGFIQGEILDKRTTYAFANTEPGNHYPLGINPKYIHWSGGLELGQHTVIKDRWLISISAELRVPVQTSRWEYDGNTYYEEIPYNQATFEKQAFKRINRHNLFMFKLGAGLLF